MFAKRSNVIKKGGLINFISFSLNGAKKSRILETEIKDIIYVLKSSKSKGFINPDNKKIIWKTQIKYFYLGFKRTISKCFKKPDKKNKSGKPRWKYSIWKTQIKIFYLTQIKKFYLGLSTVRKVASRTAQYVTLSLSN